MPPAGGGTTIKDPQLRCEDSSRSSMWWFWWC